MQVGIGISEDLPVPALQAIAQEVEQHGFASLWTNEAQGRDALLVCSAWLAATTSLLAGVGVVPLWTRSPAQLAMASATLQEMGSGRFVLGLGVSHPGTMEPWHGVAFRKPLAAARETLQILSQLQDGAAADVDGAVRSARRFRLQITPRPPAAPRWLAAMGPRMVALAGSHADGVLLNWVRPGAVADAADRVRESAAAAGRRPPDVGAYVRVAVAEDRSAARAALAREVGKYCALPAYAHHLRRQGFGDTVEAVKAAYREHGPGGVPAAIDDDVLAELGWFGTPTDDAAAIAQRYADAGLDHLVARVVVVGDDIAGSISRTLAAVPVDR